MLPGVLNFALLKPLLKPITRLFVGLIAIPIFRLFLRKGMRMERLDRELERDLEQWFRCSLLLFVASANMEHTLFGWVPPNLHGQDGWIVMLLRVMLAISVIEGMPDQQLFAIIHPGPPKLKFGRGFFGRAWDARRDIARGLICQHLNRSSPVFAIMAAIFGGEPGTTAATVGWVCFALAIAQYMIIGLVTSRDKAIDVIAAFDRRVAERREDLVEEFLDDEDDDEGRGAAPRDEGGDHNREDAGASTAGAP